MQVLSAFLILMFASNPVLAVHECGGVHDVSAPASASGCSHLKESDFFYGDPRADAPELAPRGNYEIGVRTLQVVNPNHALYEQ